MPKRKLPTALAALFALALIGLGVAVAAGGKGYATTISGS